MSIAGNLNFQQAVQLAIDLIPGVKQDLKITQQRRNKRARDMQGIGRLALEIPEPIIPILKKFHPELYQDDKRLQARAWELFIKHPDSALFRANEKI